jgi:N-acetyl-alpha-D-glucosaminyl L-malate synthase BshA
MINKKLRILMVSDCFPSHANPYLCTFVEDLAKRISKIVNLYLLTLKRKGDPNEEKINNVHIFRVTHIENPLYTFLDAPIIISAIVKLVRQLSIDIIHAQFAYPSGFYATLAKKIVKKPVVITTHRYDVINLKEDKGIPGIPFFRPCLIYALKNADAILAVSEAIKKETLNLGADPEKTFVVYNAVDENVFNPNIDGTQVRRELGIEQNEKIIFTLGHLIPRKGIQYLLRAFPMVISRYEKVKLIIGGDGPEKERLIELSETLGLKNKVIFMGRIPKDRLPLFYATSNLFVLPSLHEGHCVALLEAMASGLPIVATKVGGNKESVIDGYNGFLVPPKNPSALSKAILKILSNENLELQFRKNSFKLYNAKFSSNKQIQKIIWIYQNLLLRKIPF